MFFIGIDPGLTGGVAVIDAETVPIFVQPFKADDGEFNPHQFADILTDIRIQCSEKRMNMRLMAGVEKVHAMPGQGVSSMFKFGNTYGKILGVLAAKQVPYELITPQAWTKVMLAGENKADGKSRGANVAQRMWPELSLTISDRAKKPHSGMCDALLIAEFLRRKYLGLLGGN